MSGYVDGINPKKKSVGQFQKKCPACNGSGKKTPFMSGIVMVPGIDNRWPNKKPGLFVCDRCNGAGVISLIEPIIMGK